MKKTVASNTIDNKRAWQRSQCEVNQKFKRAFVAIVLLTTACIIGALLANI